MQKVTIPIIVLLLLSACSPSQEEIQATVQASIAETQKAMPTNTPTPINTIVPTLSLAEIRIDPEILRVEDLGLVGGEITNENPQRSFIILPDGVNQLSRELLNQEGNHRGWVSIIIYASPEVGIYRFNTLKNEMDYYKEKIQKENIFTYNVYGKYGVIYYSDTILINVDSSEGTSLDSMVYYAESLAIRIKEMQQP